VNDTEPLRFFFVHVMKTGGTSFAFQIQQHFEPDEIYPSAEDRRNALAPYASVPTMADLSAERRARIRVYTGHVPYLASQLLGIDVVTLTLLRDPVDRTISMLKHVRREFEKFGGLELDDIYDDDFVFEHFVENNQTKVFALTQEERASAIAASSPTPAVAAHLLEPQVSAGPKDRPRRIAINDQRFEQAKSNLARVDVLGLSERYGDFLDELHTRYGWWPDGPKKPAQANISTESWAASPELRRRIARDNSYDMAFYEYAKELVEQRPRSQ